MDPALDISSPFRNEAKASVGSYDQAIEQIATGGGATAFWAAEPLGIAPDGATSVAGSRAPKGVVCTMCGDKTTTAHVPKDGLYRCGECVAAQSREGRPREFPVGTFKCCPMAKEEGEGGVIGCAGCGGWYHLRCAGLGGDGGNGLLQQYATLSTTKWYCPEPACCEKVLLKQLKRK